MNVYIYIYTHVYIYNVYMYMYVGAPLRRVTGRSATRRRMRARERARTGACMPTRTCSLTCTSAEERDAGLALYDVVPRTTMHLGDTKL